MLYLHIILTDVGDAETAVVAETHQEMAVFLAFVLYLLHHAYPSSHRSAENAYGVVLLDEVAVSLVHNGQALYAVGYLVIVIGEAFHILIGDSRLTYNFAD